MTSSERIASVASIVAAALSLVVGISSIVFTSPPKKSLGGMVNETAIAEIRKEFEEAIIKSKGQQLTLEVDKTTLPKGQVKDNVQIQRLNKKLNDVDTRLQKLEQAILSNPAKALEIPLLQRDVDNLKTSHQAGLAVLKDSVDRVYDLNKWLLGGMAVSIMSLALSSLLKSKENNSAKQ